MYGIEFGFGVTLTALLLAVGHWFPWPRRLHRLAAYSYGTLAILAGAAVWLGAGGLWRVWLGMAGLAVAGGAVTAGCWLVDWLLNARLRLRDAERNPAERNPADCGTS